MAEPSTTPTFVLAERAAQACFFAERHPEAVGFGGSPYRLKDRALNLAPAIRDTAAAYFEQQGLVWHHHANHGLSSQVCCLNMLMPLAERPGLLSRVIGRALRIEPPPMLEVEDGPQGRPWFVGFEWIGRADHLSEWPKTGRATRGANATSADAIVRFRRDGRDETLLIEWKYTETYGAPTDPKGDATRLARYRDKAFHPHGPIRSDAGLALEDFLWEPFYQLLRQQMLAWRMQQAGEDGAARVSVLHVSPAGNYYLHRVTSPALRHRGTDAFQVFKGLLVRPEDFAACTTEAVFAALIAEAHDDPDERAWADYLRERYRFLAAPA